ncbi:hypothetical protein AQUCO_06000022v1 [Aquilegia coerulea]|uniref:LIM zinc-binding domain-containing protein n=1 Tax=Aquilegia coerulea TaxID=218851 RepID=A0A2G5CEV3_AQUCA|nr:hypothetical protein AQUCO_06000022v1 [Aquilegia coerulea]
MIAQMPLFQSQLQSIISSFLRNSLHSTFLCLLLYFYLNHLSFSSSFLVEHTANKAAEQEGERYYCCEGGLEATPMAFAGTTQKCKACEKTVYLVDQLAADNRIYHKACFRCHHCRNTLKLSNYNSFEGVLYCRPHFDQLFKRTGSLDKSFDGTPKILKPEKIVDPENTSTNRVSNRFVGTKEKCKACTKTVYPIEKVTTININPQWMQSLHTVVTNLPYKNNTVFKETFLLDRLRWMGVYTTRAVSNAHMEDVLSVHRTTLHTRGNSTAGTTTSSSLRKRETIVRWKTKKQRK